MFIIVSALFLTSTAFAQDGISLYINGSKINCDVAPQLVNDRTLCPTRAIFDAFGASVEWDGAKTGQHKKRRQRNSSYRRS
ncbi:MAG: copper amine oxidase N-terminal domain-containing protein [Clostridiales bacterium]|nr:MAG: copper amine oxidase N-terminal domain-containing protein [Clostridiales bacterium]